MLHDEESLLRLTEVQRKRNLTLSKGSKLIQEELDLLEVFWNHHFHVRRDRVPLVVVLDHAVQRLTADSDIAAAYTLSCERVRALMKSGYLYDDILEWPSGKVPPGAELQLNNEGVAHFASGFPAALRNPLLFARRHLSLFQLVGVAGSLGLAIATFLVKLISGV